MSAMRGHAYLGGFSSPEDRTPTPTPAFETGDRVIAVEGVGGGFFWPRVAAWSPGVVATIGRHDDYRVFFTQQRRLVWVRGDQLVPLLDPEPVDLERIDG